MALTVKRLRAERRCWVSTPEKAREQLVELRDLFDAALVSKSDAERVRIVGKLKRRLVLGCGNIEKVAFLSKIINDPPETP